MAKKPPGTNSKTNRNGDPLSEKQPENESPTVPNVDVAAETERLPFSTVAIGSSDGGLQAFTDLLRALPASTGMAYVLVQHLHPKHFSILTQLLSRETQMTVDEVKDGIVVQPNHIYVSPCDTLMRMERGTLRILPRAQGPGSHMPIDVFFESLAQDQGPKAMAVVLSGTDGDGAGGLRSIKAAGGIVIVQSPASATFQSMPSTAIATGYADLVGSPQEIAAEIARFGTVPAAQLLQGSPEEQARASEEAMQAILTELKTHVNVDFKHYKRSTVTRRIMRRMYLNKLDSLQKYVTLIQNNRTEANALYDDLLINVTEFFRDPQVFEALKAVVFPKMLEERRPQSPIRIWVPGCSTGEEVYSVAISLMEYLDDRLPETPIHIFATDISENALQHARTGLYPEIAVRAISRERLQRFFVRQEHGYQVNPRIREMCVFARQDLSRDPPFSKLDLISCRNVLIYLDTVLQKRVMPIFHYALRPNGFLLLGSSESIGSSTEIFTLVDKTHKIYARTPGSIRPPLQFVLSDLSPKTFTAERPEEQWTEVDLQREADRLILARHAQPAVIIDDELNILQFRGKTGSFLEASPGVASLNLMRMSREGLMMELRNAVQKCRNDQQPVRRENLRVNIDGSLKEATIEVIPFKRSGPGNQRYLVIFEEQEARDWKEAPPRSRKPAEKIAQEASDREIEKLRHDLHAAQEYLQSIIEEHDASNEELRSANEEILSANEELQSTNEELETAKEELQSANEELSTVNDELQNRNAQLSQTSNDLLNLLSNVSIAIVMIGNDLRIRRFTPVSERLLNLIPGDVGRPITDIKFNIDIPDLPRLLLDVIENLSPKVIDVKEWNGRPYSLRLRPYRTDDNRIEGVVMVLVDLDQRTAEASSGNDEGGTRPMDASAAEMILAQEAERRRLARELHDDLSQKLALLEVSAEIIEHRPEITDPAICDQLRLIRQQVGELSTDIRRIAYRLHPTILDDLGLAVALSSYVDDIRAREGVDATLELNDIPAKVRPAIALAIYRIVQESARNIVRHAPGAEVAIKVAKVDNRFELHIRDNGPGFDRSAQRVRGLGLASMEERARAVGGVFEVRSTVGEGTEISATIPDLN